MKREVLYQASARRERFAFTVSPVNVSLYCYLQLFIIYSAMKRMSVDQLKNAVIENKQYLLEIFAGKVGYQI